MERVKYSGRLHPEDKLLLERGNKLYYEEPSSILCSDMHLREDSPICWTGDFMSEQTLALGIVRKLQSKYKCPVIHAGDLFHHWKPSPWLISYAIRNLPDQFYTIYGQHDLPQHNWELREKSGVATLEEAKKLTVLIGCHYGGEPSEIDNVRGEIGIPKNILVWHHLTYQKKPFPGAEGGMALKILKKYPQFDLIVTGDNHQSFTENYQKRLLVNPGSFTRQKSDQIDFQPRVALWYAKDNSIKWVNLPIQENVISRDHIDQIKERDDRIDAFVSRLDSDWKAKMSFEENLEIFKKKNKTRQPVMNIIYKSITDGKE